jgi:hypothetical protein
MKYDGCPMKKEFGHRGMHSQRKGQHPKVREREKLQDARQEEARNIFFSSPFRSSLTFNILSSVFRTMSQ